MPLIKFEGPDGPEALEFRLGDNGLPHLMLSEVAHIQRVGGLTMKELMDGLADLDPMALQVIVQVLWKRQGRIVRIDEVDFDIATLEYADLPGEEDLTQGEPLPEGAPDPTTASSGGATEAA